LTTGLLLLWRLRGTLLLLLWRFGRRFGATRTATTAGAARTAIRESSEGSRRRSFGHGDLFKTQVIPNLQERRQRGVAPDVETESPEAFVQPADDVEDERLIGDRLAEVAEILGHVLEPAVVVDDGQIFLGEGTELLLGLESTRGAVPKELGFDGEPDHSGGGVALRDRVGEVVGDGAEEPGTNDAVQPHP
jgi:hypothetical protein